MREGQEFKKYATKHLGLCSDLVESVSTQQIIASVGTPMITEDREMRVVQMSVFDRLMMERIIIISGNIESRMSAIIQAQLMFLDSVDSKKDITMQISSGGGSVVDGLSLIDTMNYINSDIITINTGMCASMASVLLSSGTKGKRKSLMYSKVMTHHVSSGTQGVIDDQRISLMEAEKYNYILFKILADNCNKTFEEIHDDSNRDKWFNSDEAVKYGLIDSVINTDKKRNVTKMLDGFDDYYKKVVMKNI